MSRRVSAVAGAAAPHWVATLLEVRDPVVVTRAVAVVEPQVLFGVRENPILHPVEDGSGPVDDPFFIARAARVRQGRQKPGDEPIGKTATQAIQWYYGGSGAQTPVGRAGRIADPVAEIGRASCRERVFITV